VDKLGERKTGPDKGQTIVQVKEFVRILAHQYYFFAIHELETGLRSGDRGMT
jgi:hypothetical protein